MCTYLISQYRKEKNVRTKMSSKTDFQEFQFTENRKKVDFRQMERDSLQSESRCDLRKSLAWDSAFFTSPGVLDPEELLETLNLETGDNRVDITRGMEPKSSEPGSREPERKVGGIDECSLRKSLTWDNAFFTSSGVLNAEELSIVNRGFKNYEMHLLPRIEEEIWKSNESVTTVNSDTYALASLEIDLFDGLGESIREPCGSSTNGVTPTCQMRRERGIQKSQTTKVSDVSSRARFPAPGEEAKRPPKISAYANVLPKTPNKRATSTASPLRAPKPTSRKSKTCLHNSLGVIPSSTTSTGSPSSVLPTSRNKFKTFGCVISDLADRSPLNPQRMTIHSETAAPIPVFRTPKYSAGQKRGLVNSSDSTCPWSTSKLKLSSCTSPASSGGGWFSGSSSTPFKQELNNSATPIEIAPGVGISFDCDADRASHSQNQRHDQCLVECESPETRFKNPLLSKSLKRTNPVLTNVSWNSAPSGLRMPSPKIGFFDEENSTGNGGVQQCSFSKFGGVGNTNGALKITRYGGKHQLSEITFRTANKLCIKNEQHISVRQKQHGNEQEDTKKHGLEKIEHALEDNKENVDRLEHEIDVLSKRIGSIGFSRDLFHES